ncbi:MAG: hypothetical protein ACRCWQ_09425 [Bacilli bacterium]
MSEIIPKEILELPYVDRTPDPIERPDQRRVQWIQNGECLGAAESSIDNSGELNRGPVQVQKNVATLIENDRTINESLTEVIDRVNAHDVVLGEIGDDNLANKVLGLELAVLPMEEDILLNKQEIFLLNEETEAITESIGFRDPDDETPRNIMEDLFYVKTELGNYESKDINGNEKDGNPASGMKQRLVAQGLGISSNERRIRLLEEEWEQSDVSALQTQMTTLRLEVGPTALKPANKSIYQWIRAADAIHAKTESDIDKINEIVGTETGESLDDRITENTTKIHENRNNIETLENSVSEINKTIGNSTLPNTISFRLNETEKLANDLELIVGKSESEGMRASVASVVAKVGSDADAASLSGRVKTIEGDMTSTQREVSTLKIQVGSNTPGSETGLHNRMTMAETVLNGTTGTNGVISDVDTLKTSIATKIDDAVDDKRYVRTKERWIELSAGIDDVAVANKEFVRRQGEWKELGWNGYHIANGQKITYDNNGTSVDVFSYNVADTSVVLGQIGYSLTLQGEVKGTIRTSDFELVDVVDGKYVQCSAGEVIVGGDAFQVKLAAGEGDTKPVSVVDLSGTHTILHEGNFPDNNSPVPQVRVSGGWSDLTTHLPPIELVRGGMYVIGNATQSTIAKDVDSRFEIGGPANVYGFNRDIELSANNGLKYTGDLDKILDVKCQCTIEVVGDVADLTVKVLKNGASTNINHTIYSEMWLGSRANVNISFPVVASKDDVINIVATQSTIDAGMTAILSDATIYVKEM